MKLHSRIGSTRTAWHNALRSAHRTLIYACVGTLLLAPAANAATLDSTRLQQDSARAAAGSYREWVELLALPNDATVAVDIQKNADWLVKAFARRGFQARELPNNGKPMVY